MKSLIPILPYLFVLTLLPSAQAGERALNLQAALKGADKLEITETRYFEENPGVTFSFQKPEDINKLINSFQFEKESHGYCACSGDCRITFFREGKKLDSVSYHHGISLRWGSDLWDGDSLFTPASQKAWRDWFQKHGEARFQNWHEEKVQREKRERANRKAFLAIFPKGPREIILGYDQAFEDYHKANPEDFQTYLDDHPVLLATKAKLAASLPDRQDLASTIAKALGTLSLRGPDCGSWRSYDHEVKLVLETSKLLTSDDFKQALDSSDSATLLGLARLFFVGDLCQKLPVEARGAVCARLAEAVILHDKGGNSPLTMRQLFQFSCPEITRLLEQIALGKLAIPADPYSLMEEPSSRHAACLLLSKTESPLFQECLKRVTSLASKRPVDVFALNLARAFQGEEEVLTEEIFEVDHLLIAFAALEVLERERSQRSLNLIITRGTSHSWAAVREESVLTIERMTGKKWFQNGENERAEWHAKDIREWWNKEKETFQFPE